MDVINSSLTFLQTCLCDSFDILPPEFEDYDDTREPLSSQKNPIALPLYYLQQVIKLSLISFQSIALV